MAPELSTNRDRSRAGRGWSRGFGLVTFLGLALGLGRGSLEPSVRAEEPELPRWVKGSFVGTAFVLSFLPASTEWVAIEESDDGVSWQELVNVAAWSSATVYADLEAAFVTHRIYRLRSPGTRSEMAAQKWRARSKPAYRFHLDRLRTSAPFLVQAEIEVRGGVKVVTEVVSDGFPLVDPDPELFPTLEDLFAQLEQARTDGARQVWATYDERLGYPLRCTMDRRGLEGDGLDAGALVQYRVSKLVLVD